MAFNKIYLMTEGATPEELQAKNDHLLDLMSRENPAGSRLTGFVSSMIFPGRERQQRNFAAWKKFWNPSRVAELKKSITQTALNLDFSADAFAPFFAMLTAESINPQTTAIPQKFFGLMGITTGPQKNAWLQVSSLTTVGDYNAEELYARYGKLGKLFDPSYFSQKLGRLLFATFAKMLVIIGLSVTVLLFLYFVDLSLTLIALLPVIFALISTLGTLNLMGHPLDIPGLMLTIIIMGLGIDYSLFFVRSYQRYGDPAHQYFGLIRMTVFLAGASTLIGFGVLCTARHALLQSAGITSLLGIGYSLIGAFVILPPLLKYRLRNRGDKRPAPNRIRDRVLWRYRNLEAYPRLFARYKMQFDPMFSELPRLLESFKGVRSILDIGCGYGVPGAWLLERFPGARLTGIDPDPDRIRVAARALGENGTVKTGGAPEIPKISQPVDLAMMLDMVHFLDDDGLMLTFDRLYNAVKPDGHLILRAAVPPTRRAPWFWWLDSLWLKLNRIRPNHRSPGAIEALLRRANFEILQTRPSGTKGELAWFIVSPNKLHEEH